MPGKHHIGKSDILASHTRKHTLPELLNQVAQYSTAVAVQLAAGRMKGHIALVNHANALSQTWHRVVEGLWAQPGRSPWQTRLHPSASCVRSMCDAGTETCNDLQSNVTNTRKCWHFALLDTRAMMVYVHLRPPTCTLGRNFPPKHFASSHKHHISFDQCCTGSINLGVKMHQPIRTNGRHGRRETWQKGHDIDEYSCRQAAACMWSSHTFLCQA